jgi:hypothetical protein
LSGKENATREKEEATTTTETRRSSTQITRLSSSSWPTSAEAVNESDMKKYQYQ